MTVPARIVNTKGIEAALVAAFAEWAEDDVNGRYWREKFEEPWPYPGEETRRRNGEIARDPRDILDTEALYESGVESLRIETGANEVRASWHWDAKNASGQEYAWYVHEGRGPYARVGRPWTDEIADESQFAVSEIKRDLINAIDRHLSSR